MMAWLVRLARSFGTCIVLAVQRPVLSHIMWMTRPALRTLILLVASRYPFGQFVFV